MRVNIYSGNSCAPGRSAGAVDVWGVTRDSYPGSMNTFEPCQTSWERATVTGTMTCFLYQLLLTQIFQNIRIIIPKKFIISKQKKEVIQWCYKLGGEGWGRWRPMGQNIHAPLGGMQTPSYTTPPEFDHVFFENGIHYVCRLADKAISDMSNGKCCMSCYFNEHYYLYVAAVQLSGWYQSAPVNKSYCTLWVNIYNFV